MKIPLTAERFIRGNNQYLSIWADGLNYITHPPENPYFYSKHKLNIPAKKITKVRKVLKSTLEEEDIYKYEFNNVNEVVKYRNNQTFEDNIKFINRIAIDYPDFFLQFPHKKPLTFLNIDIEQTSESGRFPTMDDEVIIIGISINEGKFKVIHGDEEQVMRRFAEIITQVREKHPSFPDIIYGYGISTYDLPVLIYKLEKYNLLSCLQKGNEKITGGKNPRMPGTGIFDIYYHVKGDQSLNGEVRDHKAKTIAEYFKIPFYDLPDKDMKKYIGTKEILKYNASDLNINKQLFRKYYPTVEYIANRLNLPLANCFDYNASFLSEIVYGRIFNKNNMVSDGKNEQLYSEAYLKRKKGEGKVYQGASVGIKRKGTFKPVIKADFSSMYPTVLASFNLSQEITKFVKFKPYNEDGFKITEDNDAYYIEIPDENILGGRNVIVKVLKKKGLVTEQILADMKERGEYKKQIKILKDKEESGIPLTEEEKRLKRELNSKSWGIKTIMNSAWYGTLGNATHAYGNLPIALTVTGISRQIISILLNMDNKYFKLIEWDTDGIYFEPLPNFSKEKVLNEFYDTAMKKFPNLIMKPKLDFEKYKAGFFKLTKNYILLTESGEIIKHGNSLKSRKFAPLSKEFIDEIAKPLLTGKDDEVKEIIKKYMKVEDSPLEKLAMQISLSTPFDRISKSALSYNLALQGMKVGIKPELGQHYQYIKVRNGYKLFELTKKSEVDYEYYKEQISKIVESFGLNVESQGRIMDYF